MQTVEGTKLQLISAVNQTQAVVVSTLMEAWEVVKAGLAADSTVKDVSLEGLGTKLSNNDAHRSCMVFLLPSTK